MRIKLGGIMNTIFVDLEMHPVARVYTKQFAVLKTETIEIGAVMLDEHLREISSFKEYVHPDFSNIVYAKYHYRNAGRCRLFPVRVRSLLQMVRQRLHHLFLE